MKPRAPLLSLWLNLFDISVLIIHMMILHYTFILIRSIVCLISFLEHIIPTNDITVQNRMNTDFSHRLLVSKDISITGLMLWQHKDTHKSIKVHHRRQ